MSYDLWGGKEQKLLFIITTVFFLLWSIWVIRKGKLSWHAVIGIYVATLFVVDFGDVPFDYWFNFYDLPAHLLNNPDSDYYLGIVFSDGMIFPLFTIIFCYYTSQYRHPWLLSLLFASMLGIMEFCFVKFGYMVYHNWNHWLTPAITFVALRTLAHFSHRFVRYSPPVSYRFRLICFTYVFTEWPGAVMGSGLMNLYHWRLHVFNNSPADDRFMAMTLATVMGGLAAVLTSIIAQRYKIFLFLGLGSVSALFAIFMNAKGWLLYNRWSNLYTAVRYILPYLLVYLYDRLELAYTKKHSFNGCIKNAS